jgi:hypothetical protein
MGWSMRMVWMTGAAVLIVIVSVGAWYLVYDRVSDSEQERMLTGVSSVLLNLVLITLVGLIARQQLDGIATDRQRREELHRSRISVLNTTTRSYFQIKKALLVIGTHNSAKSYGEQIREIIDHRVDLQQVWNEGEADLYRFDERKEIACGLRRIDCLLDYLFMNGKSTMRALRSSNDKTKHLRGNGTSDGNNSTWRRPTGQRSLAIRTREPRAWRPRRSPSFPS